MIIIGKKYKSLNKKKFLLVITEILIGSASTKNSGTNVKLNPNAGGIISFSTALLTSMAILITNEYISKLKMGYTKLRDWINLSTLLHEKTLKRNMVDKKIDEEEALKLRRIFNDYLD